MTRPASSLTTLQDWEDLRARISVPEAMWVDGSWDQAGGRTLPVVSPRDGSVVANVTSAGPDDVDRAVRGARQAFERGSWSRLEPRERGQVLIRWADLLEQHRDELALLLALEMGKPVTVARNVELRTAINTVRWYGELADKLMDESPVAAPVPWRW